MVMVTSGEGRKSMLAMKKIGGSSGGEMWPVVVGI